MPRRTFTTAEKLSLAQAWVSARARGKEDQEKFAARHGTSARRIREFVNEYIVDEPVHRAREIIAEAIERLERLLDHLDETRASTARQPLTAPPPPGAPSLHPDTIVSQATSAPSGAPPSPNASERPCTRPPSVAPPSRHIWDLGSADEDEDV